MDGEAEYVIGIDCGSTLCKGVLLNRHGVAAFSLQPTGWNLQESAARVLANLRGNAADIAPNTADNDMVGNMPIIATGYGRDMATEKTKAVTEISAHARGAEYLMPGVRTVIDIGGQDCKVIAVENGRVLSFQMNDKCAAGTGRFVQMVLERFNADINLMDTLLAAEKIIQLNSTCAVFAESEIIGLLAKGYSREEIVGGVALSMAVKISSLSARVGLRPPVVLTGGLAESSGIRKALSQVLKVEVQFLPQGIYAGAIGAACIGGF
ncbi:acyl-CoA dehydratase activase [Treponema primitia]|uniref:acyl-CoA dehydratase activase n=1 Tax=Treponema primitia TaxID=88058 RepID=UPI0002555633|nr:acyl-CoA dehydratase activase [Treponema primitia]